ncbi:MAG: tRNA (guanine-N1)-methyltransferase [Flavobacteriaceae bacterium]|nr:tRNA (guanine-N1)-methyltransferase [Flavobacteriaceae bacterium]
MQLIKKFLLSLTVFAVLLFSANAQQTSTSKKNALKEGSLEEQFEYISRISSNYKAQGKRYEVINLLYYEMIRSNVLDSILALEKQIDEAKSTIDIQKIDNIALQTQLKNTKSTLEITNAQKDKISLFGIQLSKGFYNVILWSIIGVLTFLLLFFIYKFKNSNALTKAAKKSLEEIEIEFEEHRRIALEREQKVRRQLQDEINKQKTNNKANNK